MPDYSENFKFYKKLVQLLINPMQREMKKALMTQNVTAEIIAIGTEILLGEITDTNSVFIARTLRDIGINVYFMTTVGDNEKRITDAIQIAYSRADVVITCGGLGPTVDDMTRQAVALATGRELVFHQSLLDVIAERFASFKAKMTDNNRRQAYLPADAILIENPVGTAPSFAVEHLGKWLVSLPGVPREMKFLLTERVIPLLRERYELGIIKARVLRTAGIGESMLDDLIGQELLEQSNPTVGLAAHQGQVDVRITAKAENEVAADRLIANTEAHIRGRIGDYIFGSDQQTLEDVLTSLLQDTQQKIAVGEAGLGGIVSVRLAQFTEWFVIRQFDNVSNIVSYLGSADTPRELRETAAQLAQRLQAETHAAAGVAIISTGDDAADQADREERTVVCVHVNGNTRTRAYGFGGQTELAQAWVVSWALSVIWRMLVEQQTSEAKSQPYDN